MAKRHWLVKSEPGEYSIDDLKRDGVACWDGVRNYQARNFMRDDMRTDDLVLFYHSNSKPMGVVGVARVASESYPDPTAFDPTDTHYDKRSKPDEPTWILVDLAFEERFDRIVELSHLKHVAKLEGMALLQRGQRLSVQPVSREHFAIVRKLGRSGA